jgi:radical SAM protein (TIGR01212 family)
LDRYYPFSRYLHERFGVPVHKVCIDAGFTCPNIDVTVSIGGCTYSNNSSFSPVRQLNLNDVSAQIKRGIAYIRRRYRAEHFLAYFQSFSNTHAPLTDLRELYTLALSFKGMVGLDISTRPDCVNEEKLAYLQELARERFVLLEYGLQSCHEETLQYINRGHDYACFVKAMKLTASHGLCTCAHIILGLPNENDRQILQTADRLAELPLHFLKIHDLHVVRGTFLGCEYEKAPFPMRTREEYIDLLIRVLERIPSEIAIMRLFSQTPPTLRLAPTWDTNPNRLIHDIRRELELRNTWQGRFCHRAFTAQSS